MLTHTTRWSHPPGNAVVPSPWQATIRARSHTQEARRVRDADALEIWSQPDNGCKR